MEVIVALAIAIPLAIGLIEWAARRAAKQDYEEYRAKFVSFHKNKALNEDGDQDGP